KHLFVAAKTVWAEGDRCTAGLQPCLCPLGSGADITRLFSYVRFAPKSGQTAEVPGCPLCAKSGHNAVQQISPVSAAILQWLAVSASGQPHREHRALTRLARHSHVAPHHAREFARDGEAEPCAAEALSGRGIGLRELLEQLGTLFGGHANTGV